MVIFKRRDVQLLFIMKWVKWDGASYATVFPALEAPTGGVAA